MLKSNLFEIKPLGTKEEALKKDDLFIYECVRRTVRTVELSKVSNKIKKDREKIEQRHAGADALTCDEKLVRDALGDDTAKFLKNREEYLAIREDLDLCKVSQETLTALPLGDKIHINLLAHMIYSPVTIDNCLPDLFDKDKEGSVNFETFINNWYNNGNNFKAFRESLRPVLNRILGNEGIYFYAMKTKRSDISEVDMRHFIASFGASAKCERTTKTVNKEKVLTLHPYNYYTKTGIENQIKSITDLCAVIIANSDKHTVVIPKEENATETVETK